MSLSGVLPRGCEYFRVATRRVCEVFALFIDVEVVALWREGRCCVDRASEVGVGARARLQRGCGMAVLREV